MSEAAPSDNDSSSVEHELTVDLRIEESTVNGPRVTITRRVARVTLLRLAAFNANVDSLRRALLSGAIPNAVDENGVTALHLAALFDREGVCVELLLLRACANVNRANIRGYTPLHNAAFMNRAVAVRLLLEAGANRRVRTLDGYTPFRLASEDSVRDLLLQ